MKIAPIRSFDSLETTSEGSFLPLPRLPKRRVMNFPWFPLILNFVLLAAALLICNTLNAGRRAAVWNGAQILIGFCFLAMVLDFTLTFVFASATPPGSRALHRFIVAIGLWRTCNGLCNSLRRCCGDGGEIPAARAAPGTVGGYSDVGVHAVGVAVLRLALRGRRKSQGRFHHLPRWRNERHLRHRRVKLTGFWFKDESAGSKT